MEIFDLIKKRWDECADSVPFVIQQISNENKDAQIH